MWLLFLFRNRLSVEFDFYPIRPPIVCRFELDKFRAHFSDAVYVARGGCSVISNKNDNCVRRARDEIEVYITFL